MRAYSQLADLEILLTSIADEKIRAYAGEAIASYSAGAYRAAIVSTWIAVVFDLYQKIRYLDEQYGDLAAKKCVEEIDKIRNRSDKKQVTAWEREVLKDAYDKVKMINETEYEHLDRIQKDRHKCAHPVLDHDGFLFQPSPELARTHIRTAIDVLLSQPIIVNKAASDAFERDIESENYPNDYQGVERALAGRHLPMSEKYRINLFKFSLKKILYLESENKKIVNRYFHVFRHLIKEYRHDFESIDSQFISNVFSKAREDRYIHVSAIIFIYKDIWQVIPSFVKEKVISYVNNQESIEIKIFGMAFTDNIKHEILEQYEREYKRNFNYVKAVLNNSATPGRMLYIKQDNPDFFRKIVELNIDAFCQSRSPTAAQKYASRLVQPVICVMDERDVKNLIKNLLEVKVSAEKNFKFCSFLMEDIFMNTIDYFPDSLDDWKNFCDAKRNVWDDLERLGEMIKSYPNHESVLLDSKSIELT